MFHLCLALDLKQVVRSPSRIRDAPLLHHNVIRTHFLPTRTEMIVHYCHPGILRQRPLPTATQKIASHLDVT